MQQVGAGVIPPRRLLNSSWTWHVPPVTTFVNDDNTQVKLCGLVTVCDIIDGGDASVDVSLGLMVVEQSVTSALAYGTLSDKVYAEVVPAVSKLLATLPWDQTTALLANTPEVVTVLLILASCPIYPILLS